MIVKAGKPGTYLLRTLPVKIAEGTQTGSLPGDVLAKIIVVDDKKFLAQKIPDTPLPVSDFLKPISDEELAGCGGRKRSIVLNMKADTALQYSEDSQSGSTDNYQLQPSNSIIQYVPQGSVEEWTLFNCNSIRHPFHIHVNPMYVTKINGIPIDPYWCDTVSLPAGGSNKNPTSITFRMRFQDFSGPFIIHSQMLLNADLGMVQRVTILPK